MTDLVQFNDRDITVLRALSLYVRLFGQRQLAEALWSGDVANARRRLRRFVQLGLVERRVTLARPLPELIQPVMTWRPGQPDPNVGQLAFRLQSRWRYQALKTTVIYLPTKTVVDHFGGKQKTLMASQVSHDLGVTEVWLWFYCNRPDLAAVWRGEDMLQEIEPGQSVPDAVLVNDDEQPIALIEFGGDYGPERISAFHDDAAVRGLPYQIW